MKRKIPLLTASAILIFALFSGRYNGQAADIVDALDQPAILRNDFQAALIKAAGQQNIPTEATSMINGQLGETSNLEFGSFAALSAPDNAGWPHTALYGGPNSSGWPMVGVLSNTRPGPTEPLNDAVISAYARFPHVILPAMPLADTRPDIIVGLRQRNPNIRIHAYVMGSTTWCPQDSNGNISYPSNTYYRDYYLAVTSQDPSCASTSGRFLWMQDGTRADLAPYSLGINVNLAHRVQNPDGSYTYDVAEALANTIYEYARAGRNWDGIFIDVYCPGIMWLEYLGPFDYARAGYGNDNTLLENKNAFDLGWQAGHQRLADRLRELAIADNHPDYPISGNCGQAPTRLQTPLNGWMRENFPFQNGGTFYSNMVTWPWGLLHQDRNFRDPQFNYIFTAANWSGGLTNNPNDEQYNSSNQRKMRFGLGSAALGNGWHAFHESSGAPAMGYWFNWWYDEYGVNTLVPQSDPNWGRAANGAAYNGWLGQPVTDSYQMITTDFSSSPDLLTTNQGFETAGASPTQLIGWNVGANGGSQVVVTRDTTTAAEGTASVKVHIDQLGEVEGNISLAPATTFAIAAYQQYSVTFWAKASTPRPVVLSMTSNTWPAPSVPVTTEWRRFQVQTKSIASSSTGYLVFTLGQSTGDIWIDDVHVQAGASSMFRRDFDNGIVLLNATDTPQTFQLEKPYRKILGTVNPTLNDGSRVTSVTLPGINSGGGVGDAIFLVEIDETAPAQILDLTAGSP